MASKDGVRGLRDQAREHAAHGRPNEATEAYRRFFVLSRDVPALYGIRLSFALAEWADLASGHPPAREALLNLRQEAVDRLRSAGTAAGSTASGTRATPGDAFAEVGAISEALGEPGFAVDLFAELDERAPGTAADCAIAAHRILMRAGRLDLARKYLDDPVAKVGRLAHLLEMRLDRGFAFLEEHARERRRQEAVGEYTADVREVITLLRASGSPADAALADATRDRAVDAFTWGHVRDEVADALAEV